MADTRTTKRCGRCDTVKSVDEFSVTSRATGKRHSYCRPCHRDWQKEWHQANPSKNRLYKRKWEAANRDQHLAYRRARWSDGKEAAATQRARERRSVLGVETMYRYGVGAEDLAAMRKGQSDRCAICDKPLAETIGAKGRRGWYIDHDHDHCGPNKGCRECIRGILCFPCNSRLGWFENNAGRITEYLSSARPFLTQVDA